MSEIIARWEWRTFGESLDEAEKNIKEHEETQLRNSSEVYIISSKSKINTKIRNDLMDMKALKQVNDKQLEQWYPVLKEGFPINTSLLKELFTNWELEAPEFEKENYSYEDFINNIVKPNPDLKAVDVIKERHGFIINECMVEIAYLKFDGKAISTIAVELADPNKVIYTVKELGLDGNKNINYVHALKKHVGFTY